MVLQYRSSARSRTLPGSAMFGAQGTALCAARARLGLRLPRMSSNFLLASSIALLGLTIVATLTDLFMALTQIVAPLKRGWVISARLSWSPTSSDCAFTPVGRSVSSRYTFPLRGLARRCLFGKILPQSEKYCKPQFVREGGERDGKQKRETVSRQDILLSASEVLETNDPEVVMEHLQTGRWVVHMAYRAPEGITFCLAKII